MRATKRVVLHIVELRTASEHIPYLREATAPYRFAIVVQQQIIDTAPELLHLPRDDLNADVGERDTAKTREGPVGSRVGRQIRYRPTDVGGWLETQRDNRTEALVSRNRRTPETGKTGA